MEEIKGIKERRLISRPIQIISQEDDEIETKIPEINEKKNRTFDLEIIIKRRVRISFTGYEPISLVLAYPFHKRLLHKKRTRLLRGLYILVY